ncbi:MAG: branched-chain amino acid aminotransferase [Alphaproteobacteria bacterium GM7ARS4]|nr:branched-chain amino acid aminotransferase [Alphaproteobacteria bacterium GM7ARS4]
MLESFDNRTGVIWYNNRFVPWREACVHVLSHGLHYASAVFEGERVYDGVVFKLDDHTQRLHESAKMMGFTLPFDSETISRATYELLHRQGIKNGYVRPIAWRGSEMMAISAQRNTIHMAIAAWEWPSYFDPDTRKKGIRLGYTPWRRPPANTAPVHAKAAGLYMICTLSKHHVEKKGYDDALMLDHHGHIAESTGANIFFVINDALHTPIPDCFLDGITRQCVIDIAQRQGIDVCERVITPKDVESADAAFLTGTAVEVTPIASIETVRLKGHPLVDTLIEAFQAYVRQTCHHHKTCESVSL